MLTGFSIGAGASFELRMPLVTASASFLAAPRALQVATRTRWPDTCGPNCSKEGGRCPVYGIAKLS